MNNITIGLLLHLSLLFVMFAAGIFALLNGPMWLIVRVRVFAGGLQAPDWLRYGVSWISRLAGVAILSVWGWVATGTLMPTLLILVALAIGLFFLLDGPARLITRGNFFRRGRDVPGWLERGSIMLVRLLGGGVLLGTLFAGLRAATG